MKILILTLYFEPDIGANATIISGLAEELVSQGHEVTVVTSFPHYGENELKSSYRGKLISREKMGEVDVVRTYLYTSQDKKKFWVRLLNYASFNLLSTLAGIFSGDQDIIVAPSPPLTIGLSAALIGFVKRIPYVYNVQDINPDVLIKLGILKNPLLIWFSKGLEKFVYRSADHIVVLSEGFRQNLLGKGVRDQKISIIPNFIDAEFVRPLPKENQFREDHQLRGSFLVLYAGNLGHSQNLEDLIYCADQMRGDEQIQFLIVGNGSRKPFLQKLGRDLSLDNLKFVPFQPQEQVPLIYAAADISLVTLKEGIALDSVPSKIYTIMASARPVLAAVDPGSDTWNLVQKAGCGLCVEPENSRALAQAIRRLRVDPELRREMGANGRQFILEYHTQERIGRQYDQLLKELTDD